MNVSGLTLIAKSCRMFFRAINSFVKRRFFVASISVSNTIYSQAKACQGISRIAVELIAPDDVEFFGRLLRSKERSNV